MEMAGGVERPEGGNLFNEYFCTVIMTNIMINLLDSGFWSEIPIENREVLHKNNFKLVGLKFYFI